MKRKEKPGTDLEKKNASQPKSLEKVKPTTAVQKMPSEEELSEMLYASTGVRDKSLVINIGRQLQASVFSDNRDAQDIALATLREFKPQSVMEAQLAVQMAATHNTLMVFMNKATLLGLPYSDSDLNLARAVRLMTLYKDQLEMMMKLKGMNGQQKVTVEHVHVNAGGQAIVGEIAAAAPKKLEGASSEKRKRIR